MHLRRKFRLITSEDNLIFSYIDICKYIYTHTHLYQCICTCKHICVYLKCVLTHKPTLKILFFFTTSISSRTNVIQPHKSEFWGRSLQIFYSLFPLQLLQVIHHPITIYVSSVYFRCFKSNTNTNVLLLLESLQCLLYFHARIWR